MTYSIILKVGDKIGIGVVSGSIAVGSRVPWARYGVGGVVTQGYTNVNLGPIIIDLLKNHSAREALKIALSNDPGRDRRQVGVLDFSGETAVFTGSMTPLKRMQITEKGKICLGNLLSSEEVPRALCEAADISGNLGEKILNALEAGHQKGGDARGDRSAAMLIVGKPEPYDRIVDIRVDYSRHPIRKLMEIYEML